MDFFGLQRSFSNRRQFSSFHLFRLLHFLSDLAAEHEKKKEIRDQLTETCKSCKKKFWDTSFLRHIGQSKVCKAYYGPRYQEMKAKQVSERNVSNKSDLCFHFSPVGSVL